MYEIPPVSNHLMESTSVDQVYAISVMQPLMKQGAQEKFPVIYVTDANLTFPALAHIAHSLQLMGDAPRFIVVGIGYPGGNPWAGTFQRTRDLITPDYPIKEEEGLEFPIAGVERIASGKRWARAVDFLNFIRRELVPFIEKTYPAVAGHRTYYGHSAGGFFGLYSLFSDPALFGNYILSSPGLADEKSRGIFNMAQNFVNENRDIKAKIFLSVGGEEEHEPHFDRFRLVSHTKEMASLLSRAQSSNFSIETTIFPDETHMSVWPVAFSRGVRTLLGKADDMPLSIEATD